MSYDEYTKLKDMVIQLHGMARKYESEFLRDVADRMDFMIEEKRDYERNQL